MRLNTETAGRALLSCLCGSELILILANIVSYLLSCLCGSERMNEQLYHQQYASKLPVRQ